MPVEKDIRKALEAAMESGQTSTEIGGRAGINAVSLRQFKAGARGLTVANLEKLAVALGLQLLVAKHSKKK